MKKIMVSIILLLLFVPAITKASILNYKEEVTINNVDNVIGINNGYITTKNTIDKTIITLYKEKNNFIEKQFDIITNINIINYNNQIIITGVKPNGFINIYYLDENLRINNTIETTITAPLICNIKTYKSNNKIYLLLTTEDYLLIDNYLYEINEEYNIKNKLFASYKQEELLSILKSDYYAIKNTYQINNNETYYYTTSAYDRNYNVISGYKEDEFFNKKNIITIIDSLNNQNTIELTNSINDILIINNKLIVLTQNNIDLYSLDGKIEESIPAQNFNYLSTISNNLITIGDISIKYYEYECNITIYDEPYGTVNVTENPKPYETIDINVITNSGYELEKLEIIDNDGNEIAITNNQFTMPNKSIYITPTYTTNIVNPETADIVLIIIIFTIIMLFIWKKVYKKYIWLK